LALKRLNKKLAREKMAIDKGRALTENMDKNLHFTPKQYEEVLKINQRSINQAEYAKVRYIKNLRKMNNEIQNIGSSRMTLLKDVLTPQQFQVYNQKRAEKMGLPGEGSPQPGQQPAKENYDN
jgi:Spy/CpxP family protein refolding chaperone